MKTAPAKDLETRERLLEVATTLFAREGFAKVTVRDICEQAEANVAAVNYHFGGKAGLYEEVVQAAVRIMKTTTDEARDAGAGQPPPEQLRAYVRIFITRVAGGSKSWIHQLMLHEMADPTPSLQIVVEQVIRPRMLYLADVIARVMEVDADDPRVFPCAFSVNAQCLGLIQRPGTSRILASLKMSPGSIDDMVDHITAFSLAGIRHGAPR